MTPPRVSLPHNLDGDADRMRAVIAARDDWLDQGLRTGPSHRTDAESAVEHLYRRAGYPPPRFVWVPSPPAAAEVIGADRLANPIAVSHNDTEHASARIAYLLAASRTGMDARIARRTAVGTDWRRFRRTVWDSLRTSLFDGVAASIRTLMPASAGTVTWYGQQEAHRVAYYDIHRRFGDAQLRVEDHDLLDALTALTAATGWWWPFDEVCVMAERPTALHTEPAPDGMHGERRLHHDDHPAVEFSDGAAVYAHHGTAVPAWVVLDPTVERITRERNVEVRRCAIERIGWDTYIDRAGLALLDTADDPGNPGCTLQLHAVPHGWNSGSRILLVVNGSRERDGHRRRYGLPVPDAFSSALDAAGWTYGISGSDYSRLLRRT